jgi:hypothetical protein
MTRNLEKPHERIRAVAGERIRAVAEALEITKMTKSF